MLIVMPQIFVIIMPDISDIILIVMPQIITLILPQKTVNPKSQTLITLMMPQTHSIVNEHIL